MLEWDRWWRKGRTEKKGGRECWEKRVWKKKKEEEDTEERERWNIRKRRRREGNERRRRRGTRRRRKEEEEENETDPPVAQNTRVKIYFSNGCSFAAASVKGEGKCAV